MVRNEIFVALVLLWCGITAQIEKELFIDNTTESTTLPENGILYYRLRMPSSITSRKNYLILDVFDPKESDSDPDIFISSLQAFPSSANNEWKCSSYGEDICVVPKEAVDPDKEFHIAVFCQRQCTYIMTISLKPEIEILEGSVHNDILKASESRLYRFPIQSDEDIKSITMWLQVGAVEMNKVRMFVAKEKEGGAPPGSDNTVMVTPGWSGWAAKISQADTNDFCTGCAYKILISTKVDTQISLNCRTNKYFTRLKSQVVELYDLVNTNEKNCYHYKVRSTVDDLVISLIPFGGNPDLYVYLNKFPKEETLPDFKSAGENQEILTISAQDRKNKNLLTGDYYICIFGEMRASYKLNIKLSPPNISNRLSLECGLTRTMKVNKGQMKVFEYEISHSEKTNLTFTLNSLSGNADLYVKFCSTPGRACTLLDSDLEAADIMKSTSQVSVDAVNTVLDPKLCVKGNYCGYLVGVKGVKQSSFSLSMDCGTLAYHILKEGSPSYGIVDIQEKALYQFFVEDKQTEVIKVVLTSISGDADLHVTMIDPLHIDKTIEKQSNKQSHLSDVVQFKKSEDGSLNTLYRVTVTGYTQSLFSLTFTRENSTHQSTAIQLSEGVSLYGNIDYSQRLNYKFFLEADAEDSVPVRVQLTPLSGYFRMYIGVDYIPTQTNYTWISSDFDTGIYIQPQDEGYRANGVYNILIEKQALEDSSPHLFTIQYISSRRSINLLETVPYIGNTSRGHDQYFIYYLHEQKGVTLRVTPLSGDPDLFVSLNPKNKMPSFHLNDFASLNLGEDTIEIEYSKVKSINPNCSFGFFGTLSCPVYIAVTCGSAECEYTLVANQGNHKIQKLIEGMPQNGIATAENPALYETIVTDSHNSSLYIYISSKTGSAIGYGLIMSYSTSSAVPSPQNNDVKSHTRANTDIMIISPEKSRNKCGQFCKYVIGVYCDVSKYMPGEEIRCEFSITATRQMKRITIGNVMVDEIGKSQYKYYTFWSGCTDCTLSFSLTPISEGDPDLYIKKGLGQLPDMTHYDFKSVSYRGDFFELAPNNEFFTKSHTTIAGRYVLGVYGAENCTYTLLVTSKKNQGTTVNFLRAGVPVRMQTEARKFSFFNFNSYKKADISIQLTLHTGRINLRATVIDKRGSWEGKLPQTESMSLWTSYSQNSRNSLLIKSTDPKFITNGTYLIGVEAIETATYSLTVNYLSEVDYTVLKNGESLKTSLHPGEKRRFSYVASSNTDITIRLFTFYGSVKGKLIKNNKELNIVVNSQQEIKTHDPIFRIGTYYIVVEALNEETEFSLSIQQKLEMTPLDEGQPSRNILIPRQYKYFLYHVPSSIAEEQRYVNIFATFRSSIQDGFIVIRKISRQDMQMPDETKYDYMIHYDSDLKKLGGSIPVQFNQVQALVIGLMVNQSTEANILFDIVGWTSGLVQMTPEQQYYNTFKNEGEMHNYELMAKPGSKIFVEVIPCFGEVEFYVTDSIRKIGDRTHDLLNTQISKGRMFGSTLAFANRYFITVRGLAMPKHIPGKKSEIAYTVRSIVSSKDNFEDIADYSLEENGGIEYSMMHGKLTLKWGGVRIRNFKQEKLPGVTYKIFMQEEGAGNMFTSCGIKESQATEITKLENTNEFNFFIPSTLIGKKYVFNILAYVPSYNQVLAYNPVKITFEEPPKRYLYLLILFLALAIILGIALFIYCRKFKETQKQLEYEMTDARNLAQVSSVKTSQKYSHIALDTQSS